MDPPPPPPPRQTKPSPHRFVVKKRSSNAGAPTPSKPQYVVPAAPSPSPGPRPAPRFASSAPGSGTAASSQTYKPRFSVIDRRDQVEVSAEEEPPDPSASVLPTTEVDLQGLQFTQSEDAHKRRRLDEYSNSTYGDIKHPTIAPGRFVLSQAATLGTSEPITERHKPAFLHPSLPSHSTDPLPEFFSPHRRGERFVPGGMAAEMRSWITDLGNSTLARQGRGLVDVLDDSAVLEVDAVLGEDALFLDGRTANGDRISVVLAEKRDPSSGELVNVGQGSRLEIRDPSWEVEVDGRRIKVGVDWHVIK
ncbi:hypothetical protein C1H76_6956 [Elsinoe australis]|uniref:Uncharacterized protein n=1 Tax=Elsinoe australis TaxID=40998 RepID=A0A4U7ASD5_9PEZI|nr:hypothetical protein C1H76_6956 [Elsinoe australis]